MEQPQTPTVNNKKLSVLLPSSTHKELKLKALEEDKSITEVVLELIDAYLVSD